MSNLFFWTRKKIVIKNEIFGEAFTKERIIVNTFEVTLNKCQQIY